MDSALGGLREPSLPHPPVLPAPDSQSPQMQETRGELSIHRPDASSLSPASTPWLLLPWEGLEEEARERACPFSPVPPSTQHQHLETPWPGLPGAAAPGLSSSVVCASWSHPPTLGGQVQLESSSGLSPLGSERVGVRAGAQVFSFSPGPPLCLAKEEPRGQSLGPSRLTSSLVWHLSIPAC